MDSSILLAFLSMSCNVGNDLIFRRTAAETRVKVLHFYMISSLTGMTLSLALTFAFSALPFSLLNVRYGMMSGIISFFTYMTYIASFNGYNTALNVTIFRLNTIPSALLAAALLSEKLTPVRIVALALCVVSILLFLDFSPGQRSSARSFVLILVSLGFSSVLNIVNKLGVTSGGQTFQLAFWRFLTAATVTFLVLLVTKKLKKPQSLPRAIASGVMLTGSLCFYMLANITGDLTVVLPITQFSFAVVALISWVFFKEKVTPLKVTGLVLAAAAIFLIVR